MTISTTSVQYPDGLDRSDLTSLIGSSAAEQKFQRLCFVLQAPDQEIVGGVLGVMTGHSGVHLSGGSVANFVQIAQILNTPRDQYFFLIWDAGGRELQRISDVMRAISPNGCIITTYTQSSMVQLWGAVGGQ
jgi:hypothetical protein